MTRGAGRCVPREARDDVRALRAAHAVSGITDSARTVTPSTTAIRRARLMDASGANQLPVRIARTRVASECPDIGDIGDLVRVTVNNGAGLVSRDRDHLRDKTNGELRVAVARFGADDLSLVDRNKARLGFALLPLPVLDRCFEALIDLGR